VAQRVLEELAQGCAVVVLRWAGSGVDDICAPCRATSTDRPAKVGLRGLRPARCCWPSCQSAVLVNLDAGEAGRSANGRQSNAA
jgi:hypothetical protein